MSTLKIVKPWVAVIAIVAVVYLCVHDVNGNTGIASLGVKKLFNASAAVRVAAAESLAAITEPNEQRVAVTLLQAALADTIRDSMYHGTLHLVIESLGRLHAAEAITDLIPYLLFVPKEFVTEELIQTQEYYPTAVALARIGQPALSFMDSILIVRNEPDEAKKLAAWVIMKITGKEAAVARILGLESHNKTVALASGELLSDYLRSFKITTHPPGIFLDSLPRVDPKRN